MRRVVIVVFPRVQTLDVLGPAEVFGTALTWRGGHGYRSRSWPASPGRCAPRASRSIPTAPSTDCQRPDRHAARRRRPRRAGRGRDESLVAWLRAGAGALAARRLGLHRRLRARPRRAARRPPGHHPLGVRATSSPTPPGGRGRARPDLRARRQRHHLRRRDRRDGPRAGAGRGGPRPRGRARDRALARALREAARRPGAVQRPARRADGRARAAARAPGVDPRPPRRGPVGARAGAPRLHERAQLRPRLPRARPA